MKVLCCLDGANIEEISKAVKQMLLSDGLTIGLIYVTDSGPHEDMERHRERFLRQPELDPRRRAQMHEAETGAAQDILAEGVHYLSGAQSVQRTGRPEREIVNFAAEWNAGLIVICSRSPRGSRPSIGPKSVGHVARFVLDHAPCPVLLARPVTLEQFPLPR